MIKKEKRSKYKIKNNFDLKVTLKMFEENYEIKCLFLWYDFTKINKENLFFFFFFFEGIVEIVIPNDNIQNVWYS